MIIKYKFFILLTIILFSLSLCKASNNTQASQNTNSASAPQANANSQNTSRNRQRPTQRNNNQPNISAQIRAALAKDKFYFEQLCREIVNIQSFHMSIEAELRTIGEMISNSQNLKVANKKLKFMLKSSKKFQGLFFAYVPRAATRRRLHYMLWHVKKRNVITRINPNFRKFNYFKMKWYLKSLRTGKLFYTKPYKDEAKNKIIFSATLAVSKNNEILGVVGGDIPLAYLSGKLSGMRFGNQGFAFLVNGNGVLLAHPNKNYIGKKSIYKFTRPDSLFNTGDTDPILKKLLLKMLRERKQGKTKIVDNFTGEIYTAYFGPIIGTSWALCFMIKK